MSKFNTDLFQKGRRHFASGKYKHKIVIDLLFALRCNNNHGFIFDLFVLLMVMDRDESVRFFFFDAFLVFGFGSGERIARIDQRNEAAFLLG